MMSHWYHSVKSLFQWVVFSLLILLLYFSVKKILLVDPFGRWREAFSAPSREALAVAMEDVDISVHKGSRLVLSFSARQVSQYRQENRLELVGIKEGRVYNEQGAPVFFQADLASYVPSQGLVRVVGAPRAWTSEWDLRAEIVDVYEAEGKIEASRGVKGRYQGGELKANFVEVFYGDGRAYAKNVEWLGPLSALQTAPTQSQERKPARVSAGEVQYLSNPRRQVILNGELSTEDWILRADRVERNLETGVIFATGRCEYRGRDAVLTAPQIRILEKEEKAEFTGGIYLLIKPQQEKDDPKKGQPLRSGGASSGQAGASREMDPQKEQEEWEKKLRDPETLRHYPIVVTCEKAEYIYKEGARRGILYGSVKAHQDLTEGVWRELTAPRAVYLEDEELLTLKGAEGKKEVRMVNSIGDDLIAEEVTIYTEQGNETLTAKKPEGVLILPKEQKTPPPSRRSGT